MTMMNFSIRTIKFTRLKWNSRLKIIVIKLHHTYLELGLEIKDHVIYSKLFDKRDAFSFSVVRMPYKSSNIPYKMFYATISAEVLRICRATFDYTSFLEGVSKLITIMQKQKAKTIISQHWENFVKFRLAAEKIASDVCTC